MKYRNMQENGTAENVYKFSSTLSPSDPSYVDRRADLELYQALMNSQYCYIFNSRKMGKSSLTVRIQTQIEVQGVACSRIDLNELGTSVDQSSWYHSLIIEIAEQLKLNMTDLESWIASQSVSNVGLLRQFIKEILLIKISNNIVIFIDEIDVVRKLPFATDDFFAYIRSCHEKRVINADFNRISFVLIGTATPNQLIQDSQRTPFNIGKAIELNGLSLEDNCQPLMQGLEGLGVSPQEILQEIFSWTNGQPFLTQKLCYLMAKFKVTIPQSLLSAWMRDFVYKHIIDNWEKKDEPAFLSSIRERLIYHPDQGYLLRVYANVLKGKLVKASNTPEHDELLLSGLVIVDNQGYLRVANAIYQAIFNQKWLYNVLAASRPYQSEIAKWEDSNFTDTNCLLTGKKLEESKKWQEDKELDSIDYRFLAASESITRQKQSRLFMLAAGIFTSIVTGLLGLGFYQSWLLPYFYKIPYTNEPKLFSQGEKKLFIEQENFYKDRGILAFQNANYLEAKQLFKKAYLAHPEDAETLIYYNNAIAYLSNNYVTLAVVIPSGKKNEISQEILKGIAQAQYLFNSQLPTSANNLFLNIVIANDNNDEKVAKIVAKEIVKDPKVIGVIGHYSSEATLAALPIYERAKITLISSTSSSDVIESEYFFRTVITNEKIGETLANYASKHDLDKVVIFNNSNQIDSQELTQEFHQAFQKKGGKITKVIDLSSSLDIDAEVLKAFSQDQVRGIVLFPSLESASVVVELSHTLEQLNTSTTPELKNKLVLLGSHSMYEHEMLVDSGKFIDNLVLAVPWFSHLIKSQNFVRDAQALWKEDISWRTATSYDAAQSFIAAIRALQSQNKISSELIREHLENLNLSASLTSGNSLRFVDNESESNREPITVKVKSKLEAKLENSIQFQLESQRD